MVKKDNYFDWLFILGGGWGVEDWNVWLLIFLLFLVVDVFLIDFKVKMLIVNVVIVNLVSWFLFFLIDN